jgi:NAD-dependent DNA ligase
MNKIKQYLDAASANYYAGNPSMTDDAFDRLAESIGYNELGARQHENIRRHFHPMYSLQKYYEDEGTKPLAGIPNITTTPKLDGAAISLLYVDGNLAMALTRGDGTEGTDITDKVIARRDLVPLTVYRTDTHQVIGEVVAPKAIANARNYAAGALNLKDLEEFRTRAISFYAYGVYPSVANTFVRDMEYLAELGFETIYANDLHNIYPCDGLVFRVNDNSLFAEMGYTSKHPRGAYAKKERAEAVETEILSVEWSVGKSGKVTPVAILKPIMIGDKLVSRATLNNPGFIEMLGLCIGDTVGVILGGEIIPCITHKVEA